MILLEAGGPACRGADTRVLPGDAAEPGDGLDVYSGSREMRTRADGGAAVLQEERGAHAEQRLLDRPLDVVGEPKAAATGEDCSRSGREEGMAVR